MTQIQGAVEKEDAEILKLYNPALLDNPDAPFKLNPKHHTPLLVAIAKGHNEIAKILAHHEMSRKLSDDPHIQSPNGQTPIQVAAKRGFPQITLEPLSKNILAPDPANPPPAKRSRGPLGDLIRKSITITRYAISGQTLDSQKNFDGAMTNRNCLKLTKLNYRI